MMLLDTDHISVLQHSDSPQALALQIRLQSVQRHDLGTTAVSLEEQTRGWLARIAKHKDVRDQVPYYARLVRLSGFYTNWNAQPFDDLDAWPLSQATVADAAAHTTLRLAAIPPRRDPTLQNHD